MINKEDLRVGNTILHDGTPYETLCVSNKGIIIGTGTTYISPSFNDIYGILLTCLSIEFYFPEFEFDKREEHECGIHYYYRLYRNTSKTVWLEVILSDSNTPQICIKRKGYDEIVLAKIPFVHNLQNMLQALKK